MVRGQDTAWIWSHYWQRDRHDECLSNALGLTSFWTAYFSGFDDGARLLDLAAGCGDVAKAAADIGRELGRRFDIDAIDSASLPEALISRLRKSGVRLAGGIDVASLPFEHRSYDGVFSQYGIEYGARPQAFCEAARMLRPGGRGLFVMHHKDSAITRLCAERLAKHRNVIGTMDCFATARQIFTSYLLGGSPAFLRQAEVKFRNEVAMLRARLGAPPADSNLVPAVQFLSDIAVTPSRYDPADALRRVKFAQEDVRSWRLRQEAQQAAALSHADVDAIAECLVEAGLNVVPPEIVRDGNGDIVAWAVHVHCAAFAGARDGAERSKRNSNQSAQPAEAA